MVEAAHGGRRRTVRRGWASPNGDRLFFGPSVDAGWLPNPTKVQEHWVSDTKMSNPPTYGTTRQCFYSHISHINPAGRAVLSNRTT